MSKTMMGTSEVLEATVDSGAADTVGPEEIAEWVKTKETKAILR